MPIDSSSELLFKIGADTGDAEGNVARFRTLMGKDLDDLSAEWSDWATKVFGDMSTVEGAMLGITAGLAGAVVAVGGAAAVAGDQYAKYVEEVERGSKATGISTENMSGLKFMAEETGTSYDSLVTGLTRFASTVVRAATGSERQMAAFEKLGITQEQVKAGEKDMMPLLELVADRFQHLGSQVDKTAMARELFSRGGAALVRMLSLGSEGIKEFEKEAAKLGLTVHTQDVVAMEKFKATSKESEAQLKSMSTAIGKEVLPVLTFFQGAVLAAVLALKDLPRAVHGDFWATWRKDCLEAADAANKLSHALAHMPEGSGSGLDTADRAVKELTRDFRGFEGVLNSYREKMAELAGPEAKAAEEIRHLQQELFKATEEFARLRQEGKLAPDEIRWQMAQLTEASRQLPSVIQAITDAATKKQADAVRAAGEELNEALWRQGEQNIAAKEALWGLEIQKRREKLVEERKDSAENLALLAQLERAGYAEIAEESYLAIQKTAAEKAEAAAKEKARGDEELARLGLQLQKIQGAHMSSGLRIISEYHAEMAEFDAIEEAKTLALTKGEEKRAQISADFAAIRKALADKEAEDLQKLQNSQGWQGMFGAKFGEMIRGNETLSNEWQSSTDQSRLLVSASLEGLKEEGQKTFESLSQGMTANIIHSFIYGESIKKSMKESAVATLDALSQKAAGYALFSLALGFTDIAEKDYPGATAAFTAAAIWGDLAAETAIAGHFLHGKGGSAGSAGGGAGGGAGSSSGRYSGADSGSTGQTVAAPAGAGGTHVTVQVYGHVVGVSGVGELCGMINDAVMNGDAPLTATNTKTGQQVVR